MHAPPPSALPDNKRRPRAAGKSGQSLATERASRSSKDVGMRLLSLRASVKKDSFRGRYGCFFEEQAGKAPVPKGIDGARQTGAEPGCPPPLELIERHRG